MVALLTHLKIFQHVGRFLPVRDLPSAAVARVAKQIHLDAPLGAGDGAEVISAKELHKTIKTPRQECHDEQVTRTKPAKDTNRLGGTGIGAVVGGLLGHEVGGGNGKVLATLAGAAAGGYAGNQIEKKERQATSRPHGSRPRQDDSDERRRNHRQQ